MKTLLSSLLLLFSATIADAQQLQILDRFNGNALLNNSTITVFNDEYGVPDLTHYFTMKNNTDQTLAVFLKKTVNYYADSTSDYYCFGIRCWPGDDSTNIADSIPPGGEDYTFASHVTHFRRFDMPQPMLPHGISSITYTIYDKTTFPEPVEATVTVIYDHTGVGIDETWGQGGDEAGRRGSREARKSVMVYPNPARDWIRISSESLDEAQYLLQIINCAGTILMSTQVHVADKSIKININTLTAGLYYGRLISGTSTCQSFNFQVTH